MPVLNTADRVYLGTQLVSQTYVGETKVVPSLPVTDGLLGWYEQSMLTAVDGATVTSWPDRSINARHLSTAGPGPTYAADAGDGKPALVYPDGVRRGMTTANTGLIGAAPWTQITIFKRGTAVNQSITGIGTEGPVQMADLMAFNHPWDGTPVYIAHMYGGGNDTFPNSPPPLPADGVFHTLIATYSGQIILRVGTIKQVPLTIALTLGDGPYRVGDGVYSPQPALGGGSAIRGSALFNRVLSEAEITAVTAALS